MINIIFFILLGLFLDHFSSVLDGKKKLQAIDKKIVRVKRGILKKRIPKNLLRKFKNSNPNIKTKIKDRILLKKKDFIAENKYIYSDLISIFFSSNFKYAHIYVYMNDFFNMVISVNDKIGKNKIINGFFLEASIFITMLELIVKKKNKINEEIIKKNILENYPDLYQLCFALDKAPFIKNNDYVIAINNDSRDIIYDFFKQKTPLKSDREELNEFELTVMHGQKFMSNKKNIVINPLIPAEATLMDRRHKIDIEYNDISIYINSLNNVIQDEYYFANILLIYCFHLLLLNKIIPSDYFKKIILKTIFEKKKIEKAFNMIDSALKETEKIIEALWTLINNNKILFSDPKQSQYIEIINRSGGMAQHLKNYIMQFKNEEKSILQKTKEYLPKIAKIISAGALIGATVYVANKALDGSAIKTGIKNMLVDPVVDFVSLAKNNLQNWWDISSPLEKGWKMVTNTAESGINFIGQAAIKPIEAIVTNGTEKYLGDSSATVKFLGGMGGMFLMKQSQNIITKVLLSPVANLIGKDMFDFNIYNYLKKKIQNFFTIKYMYLEYEISGNIINESLVMKNTYQDQKYIEKIIELAYSNDSEMIRQVTNQIEKLFRKKMDFDMESIEKDRQEKRKNILIYEKAYQDIMEKKDQMI